MNKYIIVKQFAAWGIVLSLATTVMLLSVALHSKHNGVIEVECFIQTMKGNPSVFHAVSCKQEKDDV